MKIIFFANTSWYLTNFRLNFLMKLKNNGHEIVIVAPYDNYTNILTSRGLKFYNININRSGINPVVELKLLIKIKKIFNEIKPELLITFTPKVNIYAAIICSILNIKFMPGISGLGRVFIKKTFLTFLVLILYYLSFKRACMVFFENKNDMKFFLNLKLIKSFQAKHVPGTGIDLKYYSQEDIYERGNSTTFLLISRLLWDKGIGEYIEAARNICLTKSNIKFQILGNFDFSNPSAISKSQVDEWIKEGVIEYLGYTDDVRPFILKSDCVVLPSYREGLPRTLLESAALNRPVITTNAIGCRDTVIDEITGYLCKVGDSKDLAMKMKRFITLSFEERQKMGVNGRQFIEKYFNEDFVINSYIDVIDTLN